MQHIESDEPNINRNGCAKWTWREKKESDDFCVSVYLLSINITLAHFLTYFYLGPGVRANERIPSWCLSAYSCDGHNILLSHCIVTKIKLIMSFHFHSVLFWAKQTEMSLRAWLCEPCRSHTTTVISHSIKPTKHLKTDSTGYLNYYGGQHTVDTNDIQCSRVLENQIFTRIFVALHVCRLHKRFHLPNVDYIANPDKRMTLRR